MAADGGGCCCNMAFSTLRFLDGGAAAATAALVDMVFVCVCVVDQQADGFCLVL
jgi:hypothetical protein